MRKSILLLTAISTLVLPGCDMIRKKTVKAEDAAAIEAPVATPALKEASVADSLDLPPVPAAGVCDDPAARDAFNAAMGDSMDAAMNAQTKFQQSQEARLEGYAQQLIAAGAWTEEGKAAFAMDMMDDPKFAEMLTKSMDGAMKMMEDLTALPGMDSATPSDTVKCQANVIVRTSLDPILADAKVQWDYMAGLYKAEAAAKGVTLTE